jgi:hypothetical protein
MMNKTAHLMTEVVTTEEDQTDMMAIVAAAIGTGTGIADLEIAVTVVTDMMVTVRIMTETVIVTGVVDDRTKTMEEGGV